ncbi:MAG: hypothetical protein ACRDUX_11380 [Mycobacterium sp.]
MALLARPGAIETSFILRSPTRDPEAIANPLAECEDDDRAALVHHVRRMPDWIVSACWGYKTAACLRATVRSVGRRPSAFFHVGHLVLGIWDAHPVSPGHALLIPKRHVEHSSPADRRAGG